MVQGWLLGRLAWPARPVDLATSGARLRQNHLDRTDLILSSILVRHDCLHHVNCKRGQVGGYNDGRNGSWRNNNNVKYHVIVHVPRSPAAPQPSPLKSSSLTPAYDYKESHQPSQLCTLICSCSCSFEPIRLIRSRPSR